RYSRPDIFAREKAAFTAMQNARIGAYSGPGFQPTLAPALSDGESVDRPADTGSGTTGSRRNEQIDLLDHLVDRHAVGLDDHGVRGRLEARHGAAPIQRIALFHIKFYRPLGGHIPCLP